MSFSKKQSRFIGRTTEHKGNVSYIEETFSFHIYSKDENGRETKYKWIINLERYEKYKMIVISFYMTKHKNAKRIKKFKRNEGKDCINPRFVFMLFEECFNICTERNENKEYSFCFYALDDEYILPNKKEDMNKRMIVYYSYLERQSRLSKLQLKLKQKGNLLNNLYIGYNEEYCNEQDVDDFITFYEPIVLEEIKQLYNNGESLKL